MNTDLSIYETENRKFDIHISTSHVCLSIIQIDFCVTVPVCPLYFLLGPVGVISDGSGTELLLKPMLHHNFPLFESLLGHSHDDSCVTVPYFMDIYRVFLESKCVETVNDLELCGG